MTKGCHGVVKLSVLKIAHDFHGWSGLFDEFAGDDGWVVPYLAFVTGVAVGDFSGGGFGFGADDFGMEFVVSAGVGSVEEEEHGSGGYVLVGRKSWF